jgi:transposase
MSGDRTSPRFEVVASTRRSFSKAQKRAIVAEIELGATVSEVARRHNVHTSLLFRWRRDFASTLDRPAKPVKPSVFLPVAIAATPTPQWPAPVPMPAMV